MDPTAAAPGASGGASGAGGASPDMSALDPSLIPSPPTEQAKEIAAIFAGVAVTLNVISFLLFVGRMWTRSFPVIRLGWDDYVVSAAYVLVFVNSLMLLLTVPFAFGRDPMTITLQDVINSNKFAVLSQPIWAWAMALIKISVAAMLMRVEPDRRWRQFLWVMIGLQIVVGIYNTFSVTLQCIPLHGAWDFLNVVKDKKCWSQEAIRINSIAVSSFNIVTDVIFALMPINFLRKVQRPLRERIIIGVLMALGVFASIASIMKAVASARLGKTDDSNAEGITVGTWSAIEEQIAFIAACIPCLRSPFQALLQRFGLVSVVNTTAKRTGASHGYGRMYGNDTDKEDGGIRMKSVMRDAQSEESILPPGEVAKGEIWRTTEVHLEQGAPESIHGRDDAWVEKNRQGGIA